MAAFMSDTALAPSKNQAIPTSCSFSNRDRAWDREPRQVRIRNLKPYLPPCQSDRSTCRHIPRVRLLTAERDVARVGIRRSRSCRDRNVSARPRRSVAVEQPGIESENVPAGQ